MNIEPASRPELYFCLPIFNDWESASLLVARIDAVAMQHRWKVSILLVDDGSTEFGKAHQSIFPTAIQQVEILRLRRNLGHQRAIAIGLAFLAAERTSDAVVVMDGDGEDAPEDVVKLWQASLEHQGRSIIFAQRGRRTEGLAFRIGYLLYKILHRMLTGRRVEVGNFSLIPQKQLHRLIGVSELWNHYAASVFKARLRTAQIPIARSRRLIGSSKMNLVSLATHGLSAISVFGEDVGVRLIIATVFLMGLTAVGLGAVIFTRFFTQLAIPGWATSSAGFLVLALLNALMLSGLFCFALLQSRNANSFLPLRDYRHYVLQIIKLPETDE